MDESLRILIFVSIPLFFLLIAAIALRYRFTPRAAIRLSNFSVDVTSLGQRAASVTYRDDSCKLYFDAEICRGKRFIDSRIYLRIPNDMAEGDVRKVVPNVALALGKLRYEYVIYRSLGIQEITARERGTAMEELSKNGIKLNTLDDQLRITKTPLPYWRRVLGGGHRRTTAQMLGRIAQARGVREKVEVLSKSE
jgi:hypothetical protein